MACWVSSEGINRPGRCHGSVRELYGHPEDAAPAGGCRTCGWYAAVLGLQLVSTLDILVLSPQRMSCYARKRG